MDNKTEYLIKTLSRTKRKDYENFVINAIWNRVGNNDIKPVTQQYVFNSTNNEHYFIDLFFPQLNLGIEIDERHHVNQIQNDINRTEAIWFEINKIVTNETSNYVEKRIIVHGKTFEEIETQISEVVDFIHEKIRVTQVQPWITNVNEYVSGKDNITIYDDVLFGSIVETCNLLLGTNYTQGKGAMRSCFLPNSLVNNIEFQSAKIWFPKLAVMSDNIFNSVSKDWNNRLNTDGTIIEFNEEHSEIVTKDYFEEITWFEHDRYVFAKSKDPLGRDGYKFIGKFHKTKKVAIEHNGAYRKAEYYERIGDYIPIVRNEGTL